ncbi:MAG TPA: YqaJ viral recombinase family protein [Ramlibacter sp.]|nr:YqaJ viral recombinase family protein [Ramlibacter sp.]
MSALDTILSQSKITHDLVQGTPDWDAFRLTHDGASEAAAMLGLSKNVKRNELLHVKHTGLPREFSQFVQERVLDKGHEVEALARPHVEAMLGEDLYPVTCSRGRVSASCDGLDLSDDDAFEHKQWNEELAALVRQGIVPDEHMPQCQQILLVTGAKRVHFTVSDGTPDKMVVTVVTPDRAWWERIADGWEQFHKDLATYVPADIAEMPKAEVTIALPALFIHAKGEITTSNMKEYGDALTARLEQIRSIQLLTDQDFSNAKESAKMLRENREKALLAKDAMLAQTVTVGEAANMIDAWCEDMRLTALQLEKDVEREDKAKKAAMIAATKEKHTAHVEALDAEIAPARLQLVAPVFAEAIKNKRNFASMQDALDTMLATAKIGADGAARRVRENQNYLKTTGTDFGFLFVDASTIVHKAADDFKTLVDSRIAAHKAAEEKRLEAQREAIRAEEAEKAEREARRIQVNLNNLAVYGQWKEPLPLATLRERRATLAVEPITAASYGERTGESVEVRDFALQLLDDAIAQREQQAARQAELQREQEASEAAKPAPTPAPAVIAPPAASSPALNVVPLGTRTPVAAAAPTLKLGDINARLQHISVNEAGLAALGFTATKVKGACMYAEADWGRMCDSIVAQVRMAQNQQQAA